MNFHRKKINNQPKRLFVKSGAGFTLIETMVAMGIMLALLAVVLANYRRGNDDSTLNREVSLLMSNIRLAQEQTAAGQIQKFCGHHIGQACSSNLDCNYGVGEKCMVKVDDITLWPLETPKGGFGILVGCYNTNGNWSLYMPWIEKGVNNPSGVNAYFIYGDNRACSATVSNCCFPMDIGTCYDSQGPTASDGRIGSQKGSTWWGYKGDTQQKAFQLGTNISIKDIRLSSGTSSYYCLADGNPKYSPWRNQKPTGTNSQVPSNYPLQILVRFLPPDGRNLMISDNVGGAFPPNSGNGTQDFESPWLTVDIMIGLKKRSTDCKVVTVTKDGVVSQSVDSNCSFAN